MERWKNYALWAAIFAFIPLLAESFGFKFLPGNYEEVTSAFLGILVLAGIISNPMTKDRWFLDDKNKSKDKNEDKNEDKK